VVVTDRNGEPAKHVGVTVVWLCPEGCQGLVSSVLTNNVGEFQFDPITVGKYLVCSNSDDSSLPCFIDVAAASCTVEITPENPKVELRMWIPKRGITPPEETKHFVLQQASKANCQMEGTIYENGVPIRFCTKG
jgi:hypothetical protein